MSIKDLQKDIIKGEGYILSDGTLNMTHLLPKVYDLITDYNMQTTLKLEIEAVFTNADEDDTERFLPTYANQFYSKVEIPEDKQEDADYLWNEDIFNFLNNIAPNGYSFGSQEGDGACIGWWKDDDEGTVCYLCCEGNCGIDCYFNVGGTCKYADFEAGEEKQQCDPDECGCQNQS